MAVDDRRPIESRATADPLGRAMLEYQRGRFGTLRYRDGAETQDGRVRDHYFTPREEWADETVAVLERLADRGPVLDVGCGAGQHALWWQDRGVDVTAIDASPCAVRAASDRGVEDARVMDMFDLPFERDRFGAVHAVGTQLGLGGSVPGIRELLAGFARVSDEDGIAVVDNYDPTVLDESFFGYRPDPREGIAHRTFHFEYVDEGGAGESPEKGDGRESREERDEREERDGREKRDEDDRPPVEVGPTLHFLLCSPDRLRDATIGTPWTLTDVRRTERDQPYYRAVLEASPIETPN